MVRFAEAIADIVQGCKKKSHHHGHRRKPASKYELEESPRRSSKVLFGKCRASAGTPIGPAEDSSRHAEGSELPSTPKATPTSGSGMFKQRSLPASEGVIVLEKAPLPPTVGATPAGSAGATLLSGDDGSTLSNVMRALQSIGRRNDAMNDCLDAASKTGSAEVPLLYHQGSELRGAVDGKLKSLPSSSLFANANNNTNLLMPWHAPPVSDTFEVTSTRPGAFEAVAPSGEQSLVAGSRAVRRNPLIGAGLGLVPLAPSYDSEMMFRNYRQKLARARRSRDVVFTSRNTTLEHEIAQ